MFYVKIKRMENIMYKKKDIIKTIRFVFPFHLSKLYNLNIEWMHFFSWIIFCFASRTSIATMMMTTMMVKHFILYFIFSNLLILKNKKMFYLVCIMSKTISFSNIVILFHLFSLYIMFSNNWRAFIKMIFFYFLF